MRDSRGHRAAGGAHLLQHLSGEQEPRQPDHRQGDAHADAQRHLQSHGVASSETSHAFLFSSNQPVVLRSKVLCFFSSVAFDRFGKQTTLVAEVFSSELRSVELS